MKISSEVIPNPDSTYPIVIYPYKFDISQFGEAERRTLEFDITNVSDQDLEISLIDMPRNMFKLKMPKRVKAGKKESGKIEILDEFVTEEFQKSITIQVSDEAQTRFTVPVKRTIRVPGGKLTKKSSK
ncbi:MAG: hypothetical protein DRP46_10385 [Candidatus Zixiibacteriota bacterium]|nr:MAG: hypothetical protein DRP46_10385 [candidate division Zixibacteria bacterium]